MSSPTVGFLDSLLGKKRLKDASLERLFALSTARVTLEVELGLTPAGASAVVFKPLSAGEFVRAENELQELLDVAAGESGSRIERRSDDFGFEWLIVHDSDFEDLVTTVHLVSSELKARGFGPQLLAAVFRFEEARHPAAERPVREADQWKGSGETGRFPQREPKNVYWIYGYKRGAFWPFVPTGKDQERDNAEELELKAKLEKELPVEQDLTRWLALFGAPL